MTDKGDFMISIDLGQASDYTALAIVERRRGPGDSRYIVGHLRRWELGTRYTTIVSDVADLSRRPPLAEARLVVDKTGVGAGVFDMFIEAGLYPTGIVIHGGREVTRESGEVRVPKRDLVAAVAVVLENKRLDIVSSLPLAAVLADELRGFRAKISASGHDSYEAGDDWRTAPHDDLVLALAQAVWYGESGAMMRMSDIPQGRRTRSRWQIGERGERVTPFRRALYGG